MFCAEELGETRDSFALYLLELAPVTLPGRATAGKLFNAWRQWEGRKEESPLPRTQQLLL